MRSARAFLDGGGFHAPDEAANGAARVKHADVLTDGASADAASAFGQPSLSSSYAAAPVVQHVPLIVPQAGSPSIIPSPGTPGIAPNTTATIVANGDYTIAPGTYYAHVLIPHDAPGGIRWGGSVLAAQDSFTGTLTNNGVLWNDLPSGNFPFGIMSFGRVINNGKIVSQYGHADDGAMTYGIAALGGASFGAAAIVQNSGQIYALTASRYVAGVYMSGDAKVVNSGLIAVRSDDAYGYTFGVQFETSGTLDNQAGGQILAEGHYAQAVRYTQHAQHSGATATLTNAGLIEAHARDAGEPSYGVFAERADGGVFTIDNSGTIAGDFAIYTVVAQNYFAGFPELSNEVVINRATGEIDGTTFLDVGDDQFTNQGLVNGIVDMGQGNDQVSNTGTINGYTDLGLGNDTYTGGAQDDTVLGGRDDDTISGAGGQDTLLGGYGNDTLTGGAGSDGLYGEYGDDHIVAGKGDYVSGGSGNDRIELTDFGGFAGIDGGTGVDRLVFAADSRILDLGIAAGNGTLKGIDDLELGHNLGLVLRAADVAAFSDAKAVTVQADASNHVYLVGAWTEAAHQVVGGVTYRVFDLSGSEVLVQNGAVVAVQASAPAGAAGFDAGSGVAPPLPDPDLLSQDLTTVSRFGLYYPLTIFANETWQNLNDPVIYGFIGEKLTNYGTIVGYGDHGFSWGVLIQHADNGIVNYGTIATVNTTPAGAVDAYAVQMYLSGSIHNYGLIYAQSDNGPAIGILDGDLTNPVYNDGTIRAVSDSEIYPYAAVGVKAFWSGNSVVNTGTIEAYGSGALALENLYMEGGTLTNSGTIIAYSATDSYSVAVMHGVGLLNNSGTITADLLYNFLAYDQNFVINNSGEIDALAFLGDQPDNINNIGMMNGPVFLGGGDDLYDGHAGHQIGGVYGEDGADTIVGGSDAEFLYGDDGADLITGNGGNDKIDGGRDADTVVYSGARSDYLITVTGPLSATVKDLRAGSPDGTDSVREVQFYKFSDGTIASGLIDNAFPTGSVTLPATIHQYDTLTANTTTLADADGIGTLHYQWYRIWSIGSRPQDVATLAIGSDQATYSVVQADVDKTLKVVVTYVDGHGTTETFTSAVSGYIIDVNDLPTGQVTIAGNLAEGQVLTANTANVSDPDGIAGGLFEWQRNFGFGYVSVGYNQTYTLTHGDLGAHMRVIFYVQDTHGHTDPVISADTPVIGNGNAAPSIGGAGNIAAYVEQAAGIAVDAALTIGDSDGGVITGATVTFTAGYSTGDALNFTAQSGITASFDAETRSLVLTGAATLADYQTALRSVTFSSTSDNPDNFGANPTRTIAWQVDDGTLYNHLSNIATSTISVAAVDDLPVARNDAFAIGEQVVLGAGLNLFANNGAGADADPDNAALVISAVNGSAANVGHQIALASGALVTVNANGSFTYDPHGAFDYLAAPGSGASDTSAADSFTYVVNGTLETATIAITGVDSNDTLYGTSASNAFDGGIGNDTLMLTGNRADYLITFNPATSVYTVVDQRGGSPDGADTAKNIESFHFADGTVSMAVFTQTVTNGDGSVTTTSYDALGGHPWTSQAVTVDTSGSLAAQTTVTHGGDSWSAAFDTAGTQSWVWQSGNYDAGGHLLSQVTLNDDGSRSLVLNDVANAWRWTTATIAFDANGAITGVTGTNDDGSHTIAMKDIAIAYDTLSWFATPFDADLNGAAMDKTVTGGGNADYLETFAGNDTLSGGGGNDVLIGGLGNDTLTGGAGDDRFVFHAGEGLDVVTDFAAGNSSGDLIELHAMGIANFTALQSLMTQAGADVVIAFDPANSITLQHVTLAQLNAGDFLFA